MMMTLQEKEMREEDERLREMLADEEEENSNGMLEGKKPEVTRSCCRYR